MRNTKRLHQRNSIIPFMLIILIVSSIHFAPYLIDTNENPIWSLSEKYENNRVSNNEAIEEHISNYDAINLLRKYIAPSESYTFFQKGKLHSGYTPSNPMDHPVRISSDGKVEFMLSFDLKKVNERVLELFISETKNTRTEITKAFYEDNLFLMEIPQTNINDRFATLSSLPAVQALEPNFPIETTFIANDPEISNQWALDTIEIPEAWDEELGNREIKVAVIDTGIDYQHPDLADNYLSLGYDWGNNDNDPMDKNGHGTHVAGIVAASINNGIGVAGTANVSIFAEKIFSDDGSGSYAEAILAINHAMEQGANILSSSWKGDSYSKNLEIAVNNSVNNGALFIAAAGNDGEYRKVYPAAFPLAISVSATTEEDTFASSYSNYDETVDISAPGGTSSRPIYSTGLGITYRYKYGTSMATPYVAGLAALLWSKFTNASNSQIRHVICSTSVDLGEQGFDIKYGWGRINASKAIQVVQYGDLSIMGNITDINYQHNRHVIALEVKNIGYRAIDNASLQVYLGDDRVYDLVLPYLEQGGKYRTQFDMEIMADFKAIALTNNSEITKTNNEFTIAFNTIEILESSDNESQESNNPVLGLSLNFSNVQILRSLIVLVNNEIVDQYSGVNQTETIGIPLKPGDNEVVIEGFWSDGGRFFVMKNVSFDDADVLDITEKDYIIWNQSLGVDYYSVLEVNFETSEDDLIGYTLENHSYYRGSLIDRELYSGKMSLYNGYIGYQDHPSLAKIPYIISPPVLLNNHNISFIDANIPIVFDKDIEIGHHIIRTYHSATTGEISIFMITNLLNSTKDGYLMDSSLIPSNDDLAVMIHGEQRLIKGQIGMYQLVLENYGEIIRKNIDIHIYIDGNEELGETVKTLSPGENVALNFEFEPLNYGEFNITAHIPDDTYAPNNQFSLIGRCIELDNPDIENLKDRELYIDQNPSIELVWEVYDENPGVYELYLNNSLIISEYWSTNFISHTITDLRIGALIVNLTIFDDFGNSASDTLVLYVKQQNSSNTAFLVTPLILLIPVFLRRKKVSQIST